MSKNQQNSLATEALRESNYWAIVLNKITPYLPRKLASFVWNFYKRASLQFVLNAIRIDEEQECAGHQIYEYYKSKTVKT